MPAVRPNSATAAFILSFDCEGKWGIADGLDPQRQRLLTDTALLDTYARLLALLARHRTPVTFAFVANFIATRASWNAFRRNTAPHHPAYAGWLGTVDRASSEDPHGGWFLPQLAAMVGNSGAHELASHGASHASLSADACAAEDFAAEMARIREVEAGHGYASDTFIYPRNREGFHAALRAQGFAAYRPAHALEQERGGALRLARLAAEFVPVGFTAAHSKPLSDGAGGSLPLPPGIILNFAHGLRRRIPRSVTRLRLRALLFEAAARGRVLHLYSHPHNFLSDPGLYAVLDFVLRDAADLRDRGRLQILTQSAYAAGR